MTLPNWTNDDIASALSQHLPVGKAWPREPESVQAQTVAALAPAFQRVTARASNLLVDAFPTTTRELLPEWEGALGLPDPCAGESPTIAARVSQVVARFEAGGGQSIDYFVSLAATLGYAVTIDQFKPFSAGSKAGTPLYGRSWAHAWQVHAPEYSVQRFTAGSGAGESLSSWGNTVLQCEFLRLSPAQTTVFFDYSS